MIADPVAKASIDAEWARLRRRHAWDESSVREWSDVVVEARWTDAEVHMGMLLGFVVEKSPDLLAGDPRRKFKGRAVFQWNQVFYGKLQLRDLSGLGQFSCHVAGG